MYNVYEFVLCMSLSMYNICITYVDCHLMCGNMNYAETTYRLQTAFKICFVQILCVCAEIVK